MPKHTRGKIKEHLEGVHRLTEAIKIHCAKSIALIDDPDHEHTKAIVALVSLTTNLDELAQAIYYRT